MNDFCFMNFIAYNTGKLLYENYQLLIIVYGYYVSYNRGKSIYETTKSVINFIKPTKISEWEFIDNITIVDPMETNVILSNNIEDDYIKLDFIKPINRSFEF